MWKRSEKRSQIIKKQPYSSGTDANKLNNLITRLEDLQVYNQNQIHFLVELYLLELFEG